MTYFGTPVQAWFNILAAAETLRKTLVKDFALFIAIDLSYSFLSFDKFFSIILTYKRFTKYLNLSILNNTIWVEFITYLNKIKTDMILISITLLNEESPFKKWEIKTILLKYSELY